jgi:hypothetical protein
MTKDYPPTVYFGPMAVMIHAREERIRVAAYFKAERRGFEPGHELDDWLAAEREIDAADRPLEIE